MNGLVRFLLWVAVILGALGAILYFGFFEVWTLPTDDPQFAVSVAPNAAAGDTVLISRHGVPSFANLVRCTDPDAPGRYGVARLIGDTGDHVVIDAESLTINGSHASSPRACETPKYTLVNPATGSEEILSCREVELGGMTIDTLASAEHPERSREVTVDPGRAYLISDNRHMHLDSRDFGAVDPRSCKHVVFRLWSSVGFSDAKHRFNVLW